jgi:predicted amidophosphoribosyltransferase
MHPLLIDVYKLVLNALLPVRCVVCTQESPEPLCPDCLTNCTVVEGQICPACHNPSIVGLTHPTCAHTKSLDQLISLYDYKNESVKKLIIAGKYKFIPDVFRILGPPLATFIKNHVDIPQHTVVTPLPLHPSRHRWRGFNQACILSESIAWNLGIPHMQALVRHRRTKTQKDLRRCS